MFSFSYFQYQVSHFNYLSSSNTIVVCIFTKPQWDFSDGLIAFISNGSAKYSHRQMFLNVSVLYDIILANTTRQRQYTYCMAVWQCST